MAMNNAAVYEAITAEIIAALESGTAPWVKPWWTVGGFPTSLSTGKPYRGVNLLRLMVESYDDPRWGTFNAIKEAAAKHARSQGRVIVVEESNKGKKQYWEIVDGQRVWFPDGVRKGEKGTQIVYSEVKKKKQENADEGDEPGTYMLRKLYSVFNAAQTVGLPELPEKQERDFTPIEAAERIVRHYVWVDDLYEEEPIAADGHGLGPNVFHGFAKAMYSPPEDRVIMPNPQAFYSDESYYTTLFHELCHSTGHDKRLKRGFGPLFGDDPYAKEELVAEIGASFLAGVAAFEDAGVDQSAAYIEGWLEPLANDSKFVVQAAGQAQRAVDLILGTTFDDEASGIPEEVATA